jgi:hypothetical protein
MTINKIYLSEAVENERLDYDLLDTDVIVELNNGVKYSAHFISIGKLVDELTDRQITLNDPSQKYFWSKNMVIVRDMEKQEMLPMIEYMIEEGDFQMIFEKLTS